MTSHVYKVWFQASQTESIEFANMLLSFQCKLFQISGKIYMSIIRSIIYMYHINLIVFCNCIVNHSKYWLLWSNMFYHFYFFLLSRQSLSWHVPSDNDLGQQGWRSINWPPDLPYSYKNGVLSYELSFCKENFHIYIYRIYVCFKI